MQTNLPTIIVKRAVINKKDSILLYFKYNDQLLLIIRNSKKFKWSATRRCWHGKFNEENLKISIAGNKHSVCDK